MYLGDSTGFYPLSTLANSGGGGGGSLPGPGYGLYYTGTTLNVGREVTDRITELERRVEELESIINSGYFSDVDNSDEDD